MVNSLFLTDLYPDRKLPSATEKVEQTVKIDASSVEIEERGVKLRLTVVDTPGFADSINNNDCFKTIIKYVDDQYERFLHDESGLNRRNIVDNRVHCCFYFINPAGHGLKPLDIAFMKAVHHKINIVPVIAKADTLTKAEVLKLKKKILEQIAALDIQIYQLPEVDSDEDDDYKEQCKQLKAAVPFAVVGSNQIIEVKGRKVRGRMYPWGVVEVENPDHCDFIKLRTMLITHMQDLQEVTQEVHYENFRSERLLGANQTPRRTLNTHMQDLQEVTQEVHYENYRANKLATEGAPPKKANKMRRSDIDKEEKLSEKEKELAEKEAEIRRMQDMLARMQAQMQQGGTKPVGMTNGAVNGRLKQETV